MDALADEAHELSERAGRRPRPPVLLAWAEENAPESAAEVAGPVERRRGELQAEAFEIGARLYAEKPRTFMRAIERWWDASAAARARAHAA